MESLLPTEIARLVYGYLIDEKCEQTANLFLENSQNLKECLEVHKKGRKFNTRIMGLGLVDILNLYTDAVCILKCFKDRNCSSISSPNDLLKQLENMILLENKDESQHKTYLLRISLPNKNNNKTTPCANTSKLVENKKVLSNVSTSPNSVKSFPVESQPKNAAESTVVCKRSEPGVSSDVKGNLESVQCGEVEDPDKSASALDDFDLNMLQTLLDNRALHERLAENINRAIDSSSENLPHNKTDVKKIIETILHNTEADPIFDELLHDLIAPRAEDITTPEDTDRENGDPPVGTAVPAIPVAGVTPHLEDDAFKKRHEEANNLAIQGILAGNKMIQEKSEIIFEEAKTPQATVPVSTFTPVSEGMSLVPLPPGYTILQPTSTPVLSRRICLPILGSQPPPRVVMPKLAPNLVTSTRAALQPQRKRIIAPKDKTRIVALQVPKVTPPLEELRPPHSPESNVPEVIKRSRVRTRGGLQKSVPRRVKSLTPKITRVSEDKIDVVFVEKEVRPGIKTRSMARKVEDKTDEIGLMGEPQLLTPAVEEPSGEQIQEALPTQEAMPIQEAVPVEESTPDAAHTTMVVHKRVSLSTPRRASHIRTLDFDTPVRELVTRKSMTSPKSIPQRFRDESIDSIKRGIFTSPPKKDDSVAKAAAEKKKRDWDSDLRRFMSEKMDIPTSVGLKRKNGPKKDEIKEKKCIGRKKRGRPKRRNEDGSEEKKDGEFASNDDLVDRIEKEVLDAIGEEDMALDTSRTSELGGVNLDGLDSSDPENVLSSKCSQNTVVEASISDHVDSRKDKPDDDIQKEQETPDAADQEDLGNTANTGPHPFLNSSTPLKVSVSPKLNEIGQMTPTTKIILGHLGKSPTGLSSFPSIFSPSSQSNSLESILIRECNRMESEKNNSDQMKEDSMKNVSDDIVKLSPPQIIVKEFSLPDIQISPANILEHQIDLNVACMGSAKKISGTLLQTPAKSEFDTHPGFPVEMTPLTKVILSETSFLKTNLVTPTLPPTPKSPVHSPQKSRDNSITDLETPNFKINYEKVQISESVIEERSLEEKCPDETEVKGCDTKEEGSICEREPNQSENQISSNIQTDNEVPEKEEEIKTVLDQEKVSKMSNEEDISKIVEDPIPKDSPFGNDAIKKTYKDEDKDTTSAMGKRKKIFLRLKKISPKQTRKKLTGNKRSAKQKVHNISKGPSISTIQETEEKGEDESEMKAHEVGASQQEACETKRKKCINSESNSKQKDLIHRCLSDVKAKLGLGSDFDLDTSSDSSETNETKPRNSSQTSDKGASTIKTSLTKAQYDESVSLRKHARDILHKLEKMENLQALSSDDDSDVHVPESDLKKGVPGPDPGYSKDDVDTHNRQSVCEGVDSEVNNLSLSIPVKDLNRHEKDPPRSPAENPKKNESYQVHKESKEVTDSHSSFISDKSSLTDSFERIPSNVSEYLDNFVFSFTLDMDKTGNYVTKELKTSPFLNIFESFGPPNSPEDHHTRRKEKEKKITERKKRKRSRSRSGEPRWVQGESSRPRTTRRVSPHRQRELKMRSKEEYLKKKYGRLYRPSRFRSKGSWRHGSPPHGNRYRFESPEIRSPGGKHERHYHHTSFDKWSRRSSPCRSPPRSSRSSVSDHRHSERNLSRGSEERHLKEKLQKTEKVFHTFASPSCSSPKVDHRNPRALRRDDLEDGELTDSSSRERVSSAMKRSLNRNSQEKKNAAPSQVHDVSRTKLLKKVDLDHFLSIVHGHEK